MDFLAAWIGRLRSIWSAHRNLETLAVQQWGLDGSMSSPPLGNLAYRNIREHTRAYKSIREHTEAYRSHYRWNGGVWMPRYRDYHHAVRSLAAKIDRSAFDTFRHQLWSACESAIQTISAWYAVYRRALSTYWPLKTPQDPQHFWRYKRPTKLVKTPQDKASEDRQRSSSPHQKVADPSLVKPPDESPNQIIAWKVASEESVTFA